MKCPPFTASAVGRLVGRFPRALLLVFVLTAVSVLACGPDFPNWLLGGGEPAMITAPTAQFRHELERLRLASSAHQARPSAEDHALEAETAELADLDQALQRRAMAADQRRELGAALRSARSTLSPAVLPELPEEFSFYLAGALAWRQGQRERAREQWEKVLALPREERRFKSTWAAYMLGRSSATNDWERAAARYREVRTLVAEGFADSLGLAAASYGWEAQVHLRQQNHRRALELYLQQHAAGDPSALVSLRETARRALTDASAQELRELAGQEQARRVIGAWLIAGTGSSWTPETESEDRDKLAARWLTAAEAAGVKDVASAEQLALASYQAGDMASARRWIQRAPTSPTIQWLNAKLWLRAGKVDEAAAIYTRIAGHFPLATPSPPEGISLALLDGLECGRLVVPAVREFHAERGVLHLVRREYTQALDALLRAGFWMDAAYVAERVLTLEELKSYVDREWSPLPELAAPEDPASAAGRDEDEAHQRVQIRHLLARRLIRCNRADESATYLPADLRAPLENLVAGMVSGSDEALSAKERAEGWWRAARMAREHGLELLGTELEPDWAVYGGNYEEGVTVGSRRAAAPYARASSNELSRAEKHVPELQKRFHYRYLAAAMGWQAAQLLPDNEEETARILCISGSWIKGRDPQAADVFYKTLVRRCRKTSIGSEADVLRWFPSLDQDGKPRARRGEEPKVAQPEPEPEPSSESESEPEPTPSDGIP